MASPRGHHRWPRRWPRRECGQTTFPGQARELKTWISEETGPSASIDAVLSVTAYFGMKRDAAGTVLGEVVAAVSDWRRIGQSIGMADKELDQFSEAFEHPEFDAARKAGA